MFLVLLFEIDEHDDQQVVNDRIDLLQNFEKQLLFDDEVDEVEGEEIIVIVFAYIDLIDEMVDEHDEHQIKKQTIIEYDELQQFDDMLDELQVHDGQIHYLVINIHDDDEVEFDEIDEIEYFIHVQTDQRQCMFDEDE